MFEQKSENFSVESALTSASPQKKRERHWRLTTAAITNLLPTLVTEKITVTMTEPPCCQGNNQLEEHGLQGLANCGHLLLMLQKEKTRPKMWVYFGYVESKL